MSWSSYSRYSTSPSTYSSRRFTLPRPSSTYSSTYSQPDGPVKRYPPERFDLNEPINYGPLNVPNPLMTGIGYAAQAPGYILDRPVALASELSKRTTGTDHVSNFFKLFQGTAVESAVHGAESLLNFSASVPGAIGNRSTAEMLRDTGLLSDEEFLSKYGPAGGGFGPLVNDGAAAKKQILDDAYARGWNPQEIQDLIAGKRDTFSFSDKLLHANPIVDIAGRVIADPLNVALFGAGPLTNALTKAPLIGKVIMGQREISNAINLSKPAMSTLDGMRALRAGNVTGVTLNTMGRHLAMLGRGVSGAASAYRKTAVGVTAAQVSVNAADYLLPDNTPISWLTEPLFDAGRRLADNRPLSTSNLFNLYAAFNLPVREPLSNFIARTRTEGLRVGPVQTSILRRTNDIERRGVQALYDGPTVSYAKQKQAVFAQFRRGEQGFLDYMMHVARAKVADQPAMRVLYESTVAHSLPEAQVIAEDVGRVANHLTERAIEQGRLTGRDVATAMKEDFVGPRSWKEDVAEGRTPSTMPVEQVWDPKAAIQRWNEWETLATDLSITAESNRFVIGVMDGLLPREHLKSAEFLFKQAADANGMVSAEDARRIINQYPALTAPNKAWGTFFNRMVSPDYTGSISWKAARDKLRAISREAPTMRQYLWKVEQWEARHDKLATKRGTVFDEQGRPDPLRAPAPGEAFVLAGTTKTQVRRALGTQPETLAEALQARGAPEVRIAEDLVPFVMDEAGWNLQAASQSIGTADGHLAPGMIYSMDPLRTGVEDAMQAAALHTMHSGGERATVVFRGRSLQQQGIAPNALVYEWRVGAVAADGAEQIVQTLNRLFPDGAQYHDTSGTILVTVRGGVEHRASVEELSALADGIAGRTVEMSMEPAFVRVVGRDKRSLTRGRADDTARAVRERAVATDTGRIRFTTAEYRFWEAANGRGDLAVVERPGFQRDGPEWEADRTPGVSSGLDDNGTQVDLGGTPPDPNAAPGPSQTLTDDLRRAHDSATGNEGHVLFLAEADDALAAQTPQWDVVNDVGGIAPEELAKIAEFEQNLRRYNPQYRIKSLPQTGTAFKPGQGNQIRTLVQGAQAAGDTVTAAVAGRVADFTNALVGRVYTKKLTDAAKQEFYRTILEKTAGLEGRYQPTINQIDGFLQQLDATARDSTLLGDVRLHRRGDMLPPSQIARIATGESFLKGTSRFEGFLPETLEALGGAQNLYKLLDMSGSRFYRGLKAGAKEPGHLGRMLSLYHGGTAGARSATARPRHYINSWYHIFRFLIDPRWHVMNKLEADFLGLAKYGATATRFTGARGFKDEALRLMEGQKKAAGAEVDLVQDALASGMLDARHLEGYIGRAFRFGRKQSTRDVLRTMAQEDPAMVALRRRFGGTEDEWVEGLEQMMYDFDNKGVQRTIMDEAQQILDAEDFREMEPLLIRIAERNQKVWEDVVSTFHGNTNRSNLERIANSYFLYWPISYQLKVGKQLFDLLTKQAFGHKTNLGGAWYVDRLHDQHRERMARDPEYARVFYDNPALWQTAAMLLPITPWDVGVSMSRITRYTGSQAGTVLGLWEQDESYGSNPLIWAARIANLGPAYSVDLANRMIRESGDKPKTLPRSFEP